MPNTSSMMQSEERVRILAGLGVGRAMKAGCLLVLVAILAAGCVGQSHEKRGDTGYVALDLDPVVPTPPPPPPTSSDAEPGTISVPENSVASRKHLLLEYQPNELGVVPILMYHAFTSDPSLVAQFTRLSHNFRDDLQWLYDHDFHVISMRDLLDDRIDVPAGKHPVVLTFDDASSGQFLFVKDDRGELVPGPTSAVGIMEAFFAGHPDFGHTAHFGIVTNYCFALNTDYNTPDYCQQKLDYLVARGYEIGNHTSWHDNLSELTPDGVVEEVGGAAVFIDEHVKGPANMSRVLTLPFGERPDPVTHPEASRMLTDGFTYKGEEIKIEAEIEVSGGPAFSPSSSSWDPFAITRFNTDDASLNQWFPAFANGDVVLYTSDGNPDTITVPDPLHSSLANQLDPGLISSNGYQLVRYDLQSGKVNSSPHASARGQAGPRLIAMRMTRGVRDRSGFSSTHSGVRNG